MSDIENKENTKKNTKKELTDEERKDFLKNSILIHGGGWKKLIDKAVDNITFKDTITEWSGIKRIYNYYGLVEQTGSIYMECEYGHLHTSIYSDIIFLLLILNFHSK